ncbi:lectin-like [Rhincodon typus]|uniref:lectin-like n=1 Tax=Rhincodon typus TaxID=259920 RepID=UPI00202F4048|nr:lectin-like [Rhincodon typus]
MPEDDVLYSEVDGMVHQVTYLRYTVDKTELYPLEDEMSAIKADHLSVENSTGTDQDLETQSSLDKADYPGGLVYFGYCYKFVPVEKTWIEAELHCRTLAPNGHLASIHWEEQNQIIRENSSPTEAFWIGLNLICKEGTYLWTGGSSSDFVNWAMSQPDNSRGVEDCVHFVVIDHWQTSQLCHLTQQFIFHSLRSHLIGMMHFAIRNCVLLAPPNCCVLTVTERIYRCSMDLEFTASDLHFIQLVL